VALQLRGEVWDYAALTAIVEEAGGAAQRLDGSTHLDGGGPMLFTNGRLAA
jgi:fructose-1,6-bisphosphatase/inositol monophosphatase family enzyme